MNDQLKILERSIYDIVLVMDTIMTELFENFTLDSSASANVNIKRIYYHTIDDYITFLSTRNRTIINHRIEDYVIENYIMQLYFLAEIVDKAIKLSKVEEKLSVMDDTRRENFYKLCQVLNSLLSTWDQKTTYDDSNLFGIYSESYGEFSSYGTSSRDGFHLAFISRNKYLRNFDHKQRKAFFDSFQSVCEAKELKISNDQIFTEAQKEIDDKKEYLKILKFNYENDIAAIENKTSKSKKATVKKNYEIGVNYANEVIKEKENILNQEKNGVEKIEAIGAYFYNTSTYKIYWYPGNKIDLNTPEIGPDVLYELESKINTLETATNVNADPKNYISYAHRTFFASLDAKRPLATAQASTTTSVSATKTQKRTPKKKKTLVADQSSITPETAQASTTTYTEPVNVTNTPEPAPEIKTIPVAYRSSTTPKPVETLTTPTIPISTYVPIIPDSSMPSIPISVAYPGAVPMIPESNTSSTPVNSVSAAATTTTKKKSMFTLPSTLSESPKKPKVDFRFPYRPLVDLTEEEKDIFELDLLPSQLSKKKTPAKETDRQETSGLTKWGQLFM